jgi:hypothetical protein
MITSDLYEKEIKGLDIRKLFSDKGSQQLRVERRLDTIPMM